jgi:CubicO group peptidase (beta-lactamase class C family)
MARQWTVTGQAVASLQAFDDVMQAYMQQGNVRNGALAVTVREQLVLARGYTWDEPGAATTAPTSLFRIASCTKLLTRIAIYKLIESGKLNLTDKAQDILKLVAPDGSAIPSDPMPPDLSTRGHYFGAVQVQHLLQHQGGWDRNGAQDPTSFNDAAVAQAFKHELQVSRSEIARWAATQLMEFYPGSETWYSNFGFSLLGLLIEALTGLDYVQHQQQTLFEPLGIQRVRLSMPLERSRLPGEVAYDPISPSESDDLTGGGGQVPIQYGGENNANFASFGGLVMAAPDYARVLASYSSPAPPTNTKLKDMLGADYGSAAGAWFTYHNGALPGTYTFIELRDDGVSIVAFFNRDRSGDGTFPWKGESVGLDTALNGVANTAAWPNHDLFPSVLTPPIPPGPEKLHVFAVCDDTYVRDASWEQNTAGRWLGWWTMRQGRAMSGSPVTAVSRKPNQLDAFVVGLDGHIYTAAWKAGDFVDRWSDWWPVQQNAAGTWIVVLPVPGAVTAVSRDPNKLDIFVVGSDGFIYTAAWDAAIAGGWRGWWRIWGCQTQSGSTVSAVTRDPNKLDIFVVANDGGIYTAAWDAAVAGGWRGWWRVGDAGSSWGGTVSAVARDPNKLDIFVVANDGFIYTAAWDVAIAGGWRGWWRIWGCQTQSGSTVSAVTRDPNKLDIFVVANDGFIYTAAWDAAVAGGWRGWWRVLSCQTRPGGTVSTVARDPNKLDIFVVANDGFIYTAAWSAAIAGGWRGWWPIGAQAAKPGTAVAVLSPKFLETEITNQPWVSLLLT